MPYDPMAEYAATLSESTTNRSWAGLPESWTWSPATTTTATTTPTIHRFASKSLPLATSVAALLSNVRLRR